MILINYLFVCTIFGTTFLFIKLGIDAGAPPFFSAGIRFFLAGLLVIGFFALQKKVTRELLFSRKLMLIGLFITCLTFATLYWAEQHIDSGLAAVLSALSPITIMLILLSLRRTSFHTMHLLALLIALCGVGFISLPGTNVSMEWVGASIAILIGQFAYGIGSILTKDALEKEQHISPFLMNGIQMTYGGLMLILLSLIVEQPNVTAFANRDALLSLLYLILFGSIGGHGLYYWLIQKTSPVFASTWLYISPLIALIAGRLFLQEQWGPSIGIGAILILGGVFMANFSTLRAHWQQRKVMKS